MINRRAGFTVVEFIIASVLTLSLVATVSVASSTLQRTLAENRFDTAIALYAANVMDISRALNCGTMSDPGSLASVAMQKGCNDRVVIPGGETCATNVPLTGDGSWNYCFLVGSSNALPVRVDASMVTSWRPDVHDSGVDPSDCTSITTGSKKIQPPALLRTLTLEWDDTIRGTRERRVYNDLQAYPSNPDHYQENLAGLAVVVAGSASAAVSLSDLSDPTHPIMRRSTLCGTGATSLAWFPYLPPGTYAISVNGVSRNEAVAANEYRTVSL
jgi:hypothetical protein